MNPAERWLSANKSARQALIADIANIAPGSPDDPLALVLAPVHWGLFASLGPHFRFALFGRDSIETAEDILALQPEVAHDVILALCRLQGITTDPISEEEPGKIHHEYRRREFDGLQVPDGSQYIISMLQSRWGHQTGDEMIYYGTYDATPLFIRLVDRYCQQEGNEILSETVTRHNHGTSVSVRECVHAALDWLYGKLSAEPTGLLVCRRMSPDGFINQVWKDSPTAYLHIDGSLPERNGGVASIEVQGYAYDALQAGVRLSIGNGEDEHNWSTAAHHTQQQTVKLLWMDEQHYFAQGLDIREADEPWQIATITSNPGVLLDSGLLHDLPEAERTHYIQPLVDMLFSPELLTDIGIRCRAVRHWNLLDYIDYHGPNTVWPKETFDIAKGLRRAGFTEQADDLDHRLLQSLERAGEFAEFFYVSRDGAVWYDTDEALQHFGGESPGHNIPTPEPGQAWTIAAALHISHSTPVGPKTAD